MRQFISAACLFLCFNVPYRKMKVKFSVFIEIIKIFYKNALRPCLTKQLIGAAGKEKRVKVHMFTVNYAAG